MAIPPTAQTIGDTLDPHEELDFKVDCGLILEAGEQIDTYELTLLAEAVALGLTLMEGDGRDHTKVDGGRVIRFWATIDDAFKTNAAFSGSGVSLPLEVVIVTTSTPERTRNRTFLIKVAQL